MPHLKLLNNNYLTIMINYSVIEGLHRNPNEMNTLISESKKEYGPFKDKVEAETLAKSLIQKILMIFITELG